jgi:hypothetical protein
MNYCFFFLHLLICFLFLPSYFNNEQLASSNIKVSAPQSSEVAPDYSDKKKSLSLCIPRSTGKGDDRKHGSTPEDEKLIQSLSSKSAYKGRHSLKPVNVEVVFCKLFFYILCDLSEARLGQINSITLSYKEIVTTFTRESLWD